MTKRSPPTSIVTCPPSPPGAPAVAAPPLASTRPRTATSDATTVSEVDERDPGRGARITSPSTSRPSDRVIAARSPTSGVIVSVTPLRTRIPVAGEVPSSPTTVAPTVSSVSAAIVSGFAPRSGASYSHVGSSGSAPPSSTAMLDPVVWTMS